MNSDSEIKKFLLSHKKVKKSVLLDIIRSKANPYPQLKGYSTKTKGELIDLILENKNIFKTFLSKGIQNLKGSLPKDKIQDKPIKSPPKKKADKPVQKSVDKQETKKEQPVKKPVTKTAKKSDVQGVTSKKTVVEQILNVLKNGTKEEAKEIIDFIVNVYYEELTQKLQSRKELQKKYMNKKNDGVKPALYKTKNMIDLLNNNILKPLVNELNSDGLNAVDDNDISLGDLLKKFKPKKNE